jgi:hypothetical protein
MNDPTKWIDAAVVLVILAALIVAAFKEER